jgi:CRISPR-associated helicase Cas3/CRISPR-associated endonuclease Cas3-HD
MPGNTDEKHEIARSVFRWLASLHDLGKCAPGFQSLSSFHFGRVREVLPLDGSPVHQGHQLLSAHLLHLFLTEAGWSDESALWAANVVGGHHGVFPDPGAVDAFRMPDVIGGPAWRTVQREIFDRMTRASGVPIGALARHVPPIGAQMACAGGVILADWLASNEQLFPYANGLPPEYTTASAGIAADYAKTMQLGEVWRPRAAPDAEAYFAERLDIPTPRGTQRVAYDVALSMDGPGLMVVEAPTGEGKTEAALAAAEVMADRFGFNGLYFGLPTQATTNALFDRVLENWVDRMPQRPRPTVGLAHGKALQHDRFADLPLAGVGEDEAEGATASQWMRGSKKALLCPIAVGTVDQLLFAGVSAPHVMLRHVALVNKVVVVDEVHAYDAHMSAILHRALAWLGAHRVPVVLLSATLPPAQRDALLAAYAPGTEAESAATPGYPVISWVTAPGPETGEPAPIRHRTAEADPDRAVSLRVTCRDEPDNGAVGVAADIAARTADGGCVLVVRNTVPRAQQTYDALRAHFDADEFTLAHARFTADDRRRLDQSLVERFGPPLTPEEGETVERPQRPQRHVVVATQVAEASLDVDFDLVVSDLAPIDHLLQRAGRLHRHRRPGTRPAGLTAPELVVVGHIGGEGDAPPAFPTFDDRPYLHHFLLRTRAALARRPGAVSIPAAVPGLIASVYGDDDDLIPEGWKAAADTAALTMREAMENLRKTATGKLLAAPGGPDDEMALGEVMKEKSHQVEEEAAGNALRVRVGPPSVEVVLLRRIDDTTAETVSYGDPVSLPLDRTPTLDQRRAALGQVIRIPQKWVDGDRLIRPRGWRHAPWARGLDVLLLDHRGRSGRGSKSIGYDPLRGLTHGE